MKATISDLLTAGATLKTGPFGSTLAASEYSGEGVPVVSVGEIGDGVIEVCDRTRRVGPDVTTRLTEYLLEKDDIVFARKGSVERTALVTRDQAGWFLGSDGLRLRVGASGHPMFVALQLRSPIVREWLLQHSGGSTLLSLNQETISRVPIELPPLSTQLAIAEVLGALDDKIAANSRISDATDDLCEALFEEFAGCEKTTMAMVAAVNEQSVKPGEGEIRYLDISSVSVGSYSRPDVIKWADAPGRARRLVRPGDTVWSTVRPSRRSHALVLDDDLIGSTGLAVISPTTAGAAFVYQTTKTPQFTAYLEGVAEGSAYPAVRANRFLHAPVPAVDSEARDRFESVAYPARLRAHAAAVESRRLATLRDTLLPHLMSGRITVRDAEKAVENA